MLNRFTEKKSFFSGLVVGGCLLSTFASAPALLAAVPTVVASSTAPIASGFGGYVNKLAVDPSGNIYVTDSSFGRLWVTAPGATAPTQIFLQNTASAQGTTVTAIRITNPGSGYTTAPTVTFSGGGAPTTTAVSTAVISTSGFVTAANITTAGAGYTLAPTVTFSAPPAGGTTATGVATLQPILGLSATHGFTVDKYGDVIVSSGTNGNLYFLPNKGGTLCTTCNAAGAGPLDLLGANGIAPALDYYYGVVSDVAIDGLGNLYLAMSHCNNSGTNICGTSGDSIFLIKNITNATTAATIAVAGNTSVFVGSLPGGKPALNIAVDNNNHLFYVDGSKAYVVSTNVTTPTPTILSANFTAPSGVSVDSFGNVYIIDNSTKLISEIPNENGTLNPADQFVVASLSNPYYSAAVDPLGNIIVTDGNNKLINRVTLGALALPASAVNTASTTGVMNYRFNSAVTPAAISVLQGTAAATEFKITATTCVVGGAGYVAGGSCSATVAVTPSSTGVRRGAIVMQTAANKSISTAYLSGVGTGAGLTTDPATQASLTASSAWVSPSAVALDPSSNFYVADSGANTVQVISSAGISTGAIGSGLNKPNGVAVDAAGNVFISDAGNSRVVVVPNEGGTLNTADQAVVLSGLSNPQGIAVDQSGGLYVAQLGITSGSNSVPPEVLRYSTYQGFGSPILSTTSTGYKSPVGIATDASGTVYVADQGANQIDTVNLQNGVTSIYFNGVSAPGGIAFDAAGSLYVVNTGTNQVRRFTRSAAGTLDPNSALTLGSLVTLNTPSGVAVNGAGNVAISDSKAPGLFALVRSGGGIAFGNVNVGQSSVQQTLTVTSSGNTPLILGATPYVATGSTASFAVTGFGPVQCAGNLSLTVGATCGLAATFQPTVAGPLSETLTYNSNAVSAATLTALLTGTGTNLSNTTTTLSVSPANPHYGEAVTVTATVTPANGTNVLTGTITFYVDGLAQKPVTLSAAAPFTASYVFPALQVSASTHVINASYTGDTADASSHPASPLTVTIAQESSTVNVSAYPFVAQTAGSSFTLTATVTATTAGNPTGTIELVQVGSPNNILGTALLVNGSASITFAPSATGQYQILYLGDTNFLPEASAATTVQIRPQTYDVSIPSTSYAVVDGNSVTIPITVTGISGYNGNVTEGYVNVTTGVVTPACSGLPAYTTCTFSPGIVSLNNGSFPANNPVQVINLTLSTSVPPASPFAGSILLWPGALFGVLGLALAVRQRRSMWQTRLMAFAILVTLGSVSVGLGGCGIGHRNQVYPTPLGTSGITVNFSGSPVGGYPPAGVTPPATNPANIPNSTTFQLTVQ